MYEQLNKDFDGVFRFTNPTDTDFSFFWNNKEYVFPAGRTVPMIIAGETLENIQEIRKRAAYQLATREFYANNIKDESGKTYLQRSKMGNGLPPVHSDKIMEPMIEQCLKPLPPAKAEVKEVKKTKQSFRGSKALSDKDNLNAAFKDEPIEELGKMSE
jgi:hypothetical protein